MALYLVASTPKPTVRWNGGEVVFFPVLYFYLEMAGTVGKSVLLFENKPEVI